ncbi:MAG TPA: aromatic ring-hydroxylating dioxygenase subunit alpha [Vitreimonas sp.]|uniref:aromatic ring-hydroxylating oxygenase subunit alpha n=1 Tax=Vitreimonas sp. TaxID=3069702 RepID=UPI002D44AD3D|nr:aromatic ring-hydroxylating dioxygenase subunit alpha [Vitreimonas sp.]HYD87232.1 aromatic ring-hydroxylating dioxygenase subunit alpha [Vitreimonas sp.]
MTEISSLPAWTYVNERFFELERERIFRSAWQIMGHANDAPNAGDYVTLDFLGERIVTLRGADGALRSFHNVCRHRAAKIAPEPRGSCGHRLVCPYHAWSYGLDGKLVSVPKWQGFENLDRSKHGLVPVEQEIFQGFIFIRLEGGGPSVAEMMAPYADELRPYELERLVPNGRVTLRPRRVNWKNVGDNYSDGMHIPVAHPGLSRLFGATYAIEAKEWVDKMSGELQQNASENWSERAYQSLLASLTHIPADRRRTWVYYKLWPNVAFDIYPDQVDFMQFIPVSATETLIREIAYVHPEQSRELNAARYLNWRINRQVNAEDTALIEGVQAGMASSSYTTGPLSPNEVCLISFTNRMRRLIPEARLDRAPV